MMSSAKQSSSAQEVMMVAHINAFAFGMHGFKSMHPLPLTPLELLVPQYSGRLVLYYYTCVASSAQSCLQPMCLLLLCVLPGHHAATLLCVCGAEAQKLAKQAIYSLHRGDYDRAEQQLAIVGAQCQQCYSH
jgi:hypothetical protein